MSKYTTESDGSIVVTVLLVVALAAALGFGAWAFSSQMDYKNNTDKKIDAAVNKATAAQALTLQAKFAEESKSPNKLYQGSDTYGTISFEYPKTWSAYVDTSSSTQPINGYFYPDVVPSIQGSVTSAFALRVELVSQTYSQTIQQFAAQVKNGTLRASAFVPPKLVSTPNVQPGTRFDGAISPTLQGSMVVIKVRDKTLKIYTQSNNFINDYNNVLASLSFVP